MILFVFLHDFLRYSYFEKKQQQIIYTKVFSKHVETGKCWLKSLATASKQRIWKVMTRHQDQSKSEYHLLISTYKTKSMFTILLLLFAEVNDCNYVTHTVITTITTVNQKWWKGASVLKLCSQGIIMVFIRIMRKRRRLPMNILCWKNVNRSP